MQEDTTIYLQPSQTVDSDAQEVIEFARGSAGKASGMRDTAVKLYYAVRDGIRYDPYTLDLSVSGMKASTTLKNRRGWCVTKATLLAACCRAMKIPARLGFADVRNHMATKRMREQMKTDVFFWHGYTSIFLDGAWVRATPAFNIGLCEKFGLKPLEFDGRTDSIFHPFDLKGKRHMEYLQYRGEFFDAPLDQMIETFAREYPAPETWNEADFDREVDQENSNR